MRRLIAAVADLGGAEAAVLLPDLTQRNPEARLPALDQRGGRGPEPSSAITTSKFRSLWRDKRAQYGVERVLAVVASSR